MSRRALQLLLILITLVASTSLLSGCGQKGPLYLSDPAVQSEQKKSEKNNQ